VAAFRYPYAEALLLAVCQMKENRTPVLGATVDDPASLPMEGDTASDWAVVDAGVSTCIANPSDIDFDVT